ncbi:helix-turn-helix domain-containing protein [Amycolatopsis samaneae]|uniref:Helix-turn-helix domain-containing protein n=1 Tax=Amycolatopsis samaneae TaxID=664691 RepID=A0ABW5GJ95_9PSEU
MTTKRVDLARARKAAGHTQETLAYALTVDPSTVNRWESGATEPQPHKRPKLAKLLRITPEQLEDLLRNGKPLVVETAFLTPPTPEVPPRFTHSAPSMPGSPPSATRSGIDHDSWADDLDRTAICLGRQEFTLAKTLLDRWIPRFQPDTYDGHGMHLYGRSLRLLGDLRQDQGILHGPLSAQQSYEKAIQVFTHLGAARRVAQLELHLAVLDEMDGRLDEAARQYQRLAVDERLADRDRTRAQLWIGTALSKRGLNTEAVRFILPAIQHFEALEEPQDWSIAYQKLALAHRGAADLRHATEAIDVALSHRPGDAPMQRVRLDTAHAHILLSDTATADSGLDLLEGAAATSTRYGMMHQLQSIRGIRRAYEHQA